MLDTRYTSVNIKVKNGIPVSCWLTVQENDNPMEHTDLELDKAKKLMWELKKAGGDRGIDVDVVNPKSYIYYVVHMFFWYHN